MCTFSSAHATISVVLRTKCSSHDQNAFWCVRLSSRDAKSMLTVATFLKTAVILFNVCSIRVFHSINSSNVCFFIANQISSNLYVFRSIKTQIGKKKSLGEEVLAARVTRLVSEVAQCVGVQLSYDALSLASFSIVSSMVRIIIKSVSEQEKLLGKVETSALQ